MKILIITPACHFQNRGAAQHDIYATVGLLKNLGCEVAMYTIASSAQSQSALDALKIELGITIKTFLPSMDGGGWLSRACRQWALFDRAADVFAQMVKDNEFTAYVDAFQPDRIMSFCSYSWPVLEYGKQVGIKTIFRSHNFEASFFLEALNPRDYWRLGNYVRWLAKYLGEKKAVRFADAVATLPFAEMSLYRRWKKSGVFNFTLTFLGDVIKPPRVNANKKPLDLFFLGASYNIVFHLRGAKLLIEEIAPRVLAAAPGQFRFHVCGGKLPDYLARKCNQDTLIYEGYVQDLDAFLAGMDAGVFPVMTGKTMKGKVFESLSRGFPIVIPRLGFGGYTLTSDENILIADTVPEFVAQVLRLSDPALRERLAAGAHAFAEREFSTEAVSAVLRSILAYE